MLKVAVIGAGAISQAHIKAYLQFPERCQIVAVCDIYAEKAQVRIDELSLRTLGRFRAIHPCYRPIVRRAPALAAKKRLKKAGEQLLKGLVLFVTVMVEARTGENNAAYF